MNLIGSSNITIYKKSGQTISDDGILENIYEDPVQSKAVVHSVPWREITSSNLDQNQEWIYVYTEQVIRCSDADSVGSGIDYIEYKGKKYRAKTYAENWYEQGGWAKLLMYRDDRL
ncbi:MAG: hypothetical protein EBX50_01420 [Chitinophagia bacterium]|nr:hypothetical protein [Chitinophagia bacterium]